MRTLLCTVPVMGDTYELRLSGEVDKPTPDHDQLIIWIPEPSLQSFVETIALAVSICWLERSRVPLVS